MRLLLFRHFSQRSEKFVSDFFDGEIKKFLLANLAIILIFFSGYEIADTALLHRHLPEWFPAAYLLKGLSVSLPVLAVSVVWFFKRRLFSIGSPSAFEPSSDETPFFMNTRQRFHWLISLRWIVILMAGAAVILSIQVLGFLPRESGPPLLATFLGLVMFNFLLVMLVERWPVMENFIFFQLVIDLLFLTLFISFSGGVENPFFLLYTVHPILGSILLRRRDAMGLTAVTAVIFLMMVGSQYLGFFPHFCYHHLLPSAYYYHAAKDASQCWAMAGAFLLVVVVTSSITITLVQELRSTSAQLIQESKMAAVGELAGSVAHEINNPMGVILGKAKMLLTGPDAGALPEKVSGDLHKIVKHSERVAALVRGLLAFSRPSRGRREALSLNELVHLTLPLFRDRLLEHHIELTLALDPSQPQLTGNSNELQQVLLNLVNNAVDAMPEGGRLLVATSVQPGPVQGEARAVLRVEDSGTGMSRGNMERVFQPFFTTKPDGKGTGLGLSISLGLVKSHGGSIEVKSQMGKGSAFLVTLPLKDAATKRGAAYETR